MKDLTNCRNISLAVYGLGALLAISGGQLFGFDMSWIMPFLLIGVSGFGLYCTLRCNKSCNKGACPTQTKDTKKA